MNKAIYTLYKDLIKVKRKNTRLSMAKLDEGFMIEFKHLKENPLNKPTCSFERVKGKLNITHLKLSEEGMETLLFAYMKLKYPATFL